MQTPQNLQTQAEHPHPEFAFLPVPSQVLVSTVHTLAQAQTLTRSRQ